MAKFFSEEELKIARAVYTAGLSDKLLDFLKCRHDVVIKQLKVANSEIFKCIQGRVNELDDIIEFIVSGKK